MALTLKQYLYDRICFDIATGCWNWTKSLAGNRYGTIWFNKKKMTAHRASYEEFVGSIPEGLNVCHKCDNTKCINPFHLFLGTQKDNMTDCSRKGRFHKHSGSFKSGENHKMAKLSEDQVLYIKDLLRVGCTQSEIARKFSIKQSTVSNIKTGKRWKFIGESYVKM